MLKEAIEKILGLAPPIQVLVDERVYTDKALMAVKPPIEAAINVSSLQGFANLIREKLNDLDATDRLIHVVDYCTVKLIERTTDQWAQRVTDINATPVPTEAFSFGKFLSQEEFIIGVAAKFAETEDKKYVIDIASSLTATGTKQAEDDGLTQKITAKRGLSLPSEKVVKNRVTLAPFRTFPEVRQPASEFLFRLRADREDSMPTLALFEADGGKWKLDAINEICRYLEVLELGIPVIA
jgi:hypothetical protein